MEASLFIYEMYFPLTKGQHESAQRFIERRVSQSSGRIIPVRSCLWCKELLYRKDESAFVFRVLDSLVLDGEGASVTLLCFLEWKH